MKSVEFKSLDQFWKTLPVSDPFPVVDLAIQLFCQSNQKDWPILYWGQTPNIAVLLAKGCCQVSDKNETRLIQAPAVLFDHEALHLQPVEKDYLILAGSSFFIFERRDLQLTPKDTFSEIYALAE